MEILDVTNYNKIYNMNEPLTIKLDENYLITHSKELKSRDFLWNTITEYKVSRYLQKNFYNNTNAKLFADLVQNNGDFELDNKTWELKENKGSLSSGYLSLEVINTRYRKASGLLRSALDRVDYFAVYLPSYSNFNKRHKKVKDKLIVFNTKDLYEWVISQDEIKAENNKEIYSNALCYKIPVKYITDSASFSELIIQEYDIPEEDIKEIKVPREIYGLFEKE